MTRLLRALLLALFAAPLAALPISAQAEESGEPIYHKFLVTGARTFIFEQDPAKTPGNGKDGERDDMQSGRIVWEYKHNTRDGWVLEDGNILLTMTRTKEEGEFPHGGVVIVDPRQDNKRLFEFHGTQHEVNTSQLLEDGNILLVEAGLKPRILEVDREGNIVAEVPLECQLKDIHMQSRMTRKLPSGNYLVPQLHDKVVREYTPEGKIVWEVPTPHWAFTAIRLENGNTLINCTYGNITIEVDPEGKTVWQVTNDDLPGDPIKDACGGQRLPNGHTVISSYGIGEKGTKLTELTRDKQIVWQFITPAPHGFHHIQILETNGKPVEGKPLR